MMQILIEIDEEIYNDIKQGKIYKSYHDVPQESVVAIANGTPLPKGHGDLIDRDDLLADSYCIDDWSGNEVNIVDVMTVKMADAIIEADKVYEVEVVTRGKCMMCGKELTDGLFFCKECGDKANDGK